MRPIVTEAGRVRLVVAGLWAALTAALVLTAPTARVAGAIALVAGAYAILRWTPRPPGALDRTVRAVWLLPVALGLLVPALLGILGAGQRVLTGLGEVDPDGAWVLAAATAAVCAGFLWLALRWPARWPDWSFLLVVGLAALALRLAFVAWVRMDPVSDFRGMWEMAGRVAEEGPEAAIGSERHLVRLHFQRGLPYLLPLHLLFGPSRWSYAIPNCLVTVGSSLLTFLLARRFFGARAARVAFVLSLLAIEPVLASGIPSHDIPGAFLTLAAFLVFLGADAAARRGVWRRALALGLVLGLLLPVLDLQRNTSRFLIAAFGLYLVGTMVVRHVRRPADGQGWRRSAARVGVALVLPLAASAAVNAGLRATDLRMDRETDRHWQLRAIAAHTDSWSSGRYAHAAEYYRRLHLDGDGWRELTLRKLATDVARNPEARLSYLLRKSLLVFDLGRQQAFYLAGARFPDGGEVGRGLRRDAAFVNRCFVVLFLTLLLTGSLSAWRDQRVAGEALLPALYLALFLSALLVLFQAQPRYAFQIWYLGAVYAGALFRRPGAHDPEGEA